MERLTTKIDVLYARVDNLLKERRCEYVDVAVDTSNQFYDDNQSNIKQEVLQEVFVKDEVIQLNFFLSFFEIIASFVLISSMSVFLYKAFT